MGLDFFVEAVGEASEHRFGAFVSDRPHAAAAFRAERARFSVEELEDGVDAADRLLETVPALDPFRSSWYARMYQLWIDPVSGPQRHPVVPPRKCRA